MNISELVTHAGDIADETISLAKGVQYTNDAIAKINMYAKTKFPFMDALDPQGQFVFDETWQRTLLVPFVAGRIKTKDSSQFEYTDFYQEFLDAVAEFRTQYLVPDLYRSHDGEIWDPVTQTWGTITSDIYVNKPFGWGGW